MDSEAFYLQDDVKLRGNEKRYTPLNPPPVERVDRNMTPLLWRKKPKGPDLAPNLNRLIQQERMDNEQLGYSVSVQKYKKNLFGVLKGKFCQIYS